MKKTVVRTTNNPINITDFEFKIPNCTRSVPQFMAKLKCFILYYVTFLLTIQPGIISYLLSSIKFRTLETNMKV